MKENADKYLDDLSRKVIGKSSVESTSVDFTSSVMSEIKALNKSAVTTYVPLISKRTWSLIAMAFTAIVVYAVMMPAENESQWLKKWNLDEVLTLNYSIENPLANLGLSQVSLYATLLLTLMLCVQIPLLKHYFNKRLN